MESQLIKLLCYIMFMVGVIVFAILSFIPAVYGRYAGPKSWFGLGVNANVAWFFQESPSFFIPVVFWLLEFWRTGTLDLTQTALASMFVFHYWQRTFLYSVLIRGGKATPIGICALAFTFCTVNGYIQIRSIQLKQFEDKWQKKPSVLLGIISYLCGLAINMHSDYILRNLRAPGETGYKIPKGGMFAYVTAANYFGEALEWLGFFLAVQTLAAAAFSFFTFANLFPRAVMHHRWYQQKYEDYPKNRKIMIPFIL
ncbi:3-oxo-5-alpha-steroid 4-dehydrogenase 1-like [Rhopilema esculentum]|uniref:3-oxo-5-alpha-steroid 4-dehydrogenase 1-like n=1 Tax=Rhopilema esculentum TaxID=499914 RepID=UPI0031D2A734